MTPGQLRQCRARALIALVVVALASAACASEADSARPPTVGTAAPPSFEVVLGGDSVMAGLVAAIQTALGDRAHVDYLAAPTISTPADKAAWRQGIRQHDPDLVVVLVGNWEVLQPGFAPTEAGWSTTYAHDVLDPLAASLTAGGARVLWIEMHSALNPSTTFNFSVLATQVRALAARNASFDVIDSGNHVDLPNDQLADVLPGRSGPERIRRLDGTGVHLCPAGVVRLARPVLRWVEQHAPSPFTLEPGWEDGAWRSPRQLPDPQQCPPATSVTTAPS